MKMNAGRKSAEPNTSSARFRSMLLIGCVLILLLGLRQVRHSNESARNTISANTTGAQASPDSSGIERKRWGLPRPSTGPELSAEATVAGKLLQFTRSRRELARAMAKRKGVEMPREVERFFDALESGNWAEIDSQFAVLSKMCRQYENSTTPDSPKLDPVWHAVLDAYGVAEQVHEWPAQKLLDYGNAILDSLRPGMVYVGGTDNGRWIPELLNETSGREPHVIVTQNALADGRYVEYMQTLYGDHLATLTEEDSKRAFGDYVSDAERRLKHDQEFPDEPKQIRHGEEVEMIDGKVHVGGQIAVMSINEKLLQALMAKNPDLNFAIQESTPLLGTYAGALPLGPLMELGAQNAQNAFTAERAAQSLDYWRNAAQGIFSDPEAIGSTYALKSYSHDTVAAANLLAAHHFTAEAEEAYHIAAQLWPGNAESVAGLAGILLRDGREAEARQLIQDFNLKHPDQREDLERISAAVRSIGPAQRKGP